MLLIVIAACTHEVEHDVVASLSVFGAVCPSPADAEPILTDLTRTTSTHFDGEACSFKHWITIGEPEPMSGQPACCYAATCDTRPSAFESALLYQATCLGNRCETFDLSTFPPDYVMKRVDETGLPCRIDTATLAADTMVTQCSYPSRALYTCH